MTSGRFFGVNLRTLPGAKQKDIDAPALRKALRVLSHPLTLLFYRIGVTPMQISLLYLLLAFVIGWLFAHPARDMVLLGGLLLFLALLLDRVDGSIARMRRMASDYGYWIDRTFNDISRSVIFLGAMWGVWLGTGNAQYFLLGSISLLLYLLAGSFYDTFRFVFPYAETVIATARRRRAFLKQFVFNEPTVPFVMVLFALSGHLDWFFLVAPVWGGGYFVVLYGLLTRKIARAEKARESTQDTEVT